MYSKRIYLCGIFIIILTILSLTACEQSFDIPPQSDLATKDDLNSVCIYTEKTKYISSDNFIKYKITNNSDDDFIFVEGVDNFILQRYENGSWNDYPFKDNRSTTFECYELKISKGENIEFEIELKKHFNIPMDKGYYRIKHGVISNVFLIE